jgi:acetyltransferase-like isoleucine patch superfamily enzyme
MILRLLKLAFRGIPIFLWQGLVSAIRDNDSKLAGAIRRRIYSTPCLIGTGVFIMNSRLFRAGIGSSLNHGCFINNAFGSVVLGNNAHMGAYCHVNACYGTVKIGDNTSIGPGTRIACYSNHYQIDGRWTKTYITENITIGDYVLIGANCVILPGAQIPDNAVIEPGSVIRPLRTAKALAGRSPRV